MAVEVTLEDAEWMVGRAGLSEVASVQRLPGGWDNSNLRLDLVDGTSFVQDMAGPEEPEGCSNRDTAPHLARWSRRSDRDSDCARGWEQNGRQGWCRLDPDAARCRGPPRLRPSSSGESWSDYGETA